jgi:hypothetical protein
MPIHGELLKPGIGISERTVFPMMPKNKNLTASTCLHAAADRIVPGLKFGFFKRTYRALPG